MGTYLNKIIFFIFLFLLLLPSFAGKAICQNQEIAIIVHPENPITQITERHVSDIYLGRRKTFPNGKPVFPLEHERNAPLRRLFFSLINGMDIKRVNAYWTRLQFSGNVLPPLALDNDTAILEAVQTDLFAIGYVDATHLDESVKAILILGQ